MNIAVISFQDIEVTEGIEDLLEQYSDVEELKVLLPVLRKDKEFTKCIMDMCKEKGAKVTLFFASADGLDEFIKEADDITVTENPVKEVLRQLTVEDALGIVWDDSPQAHFALHSVEDLAIETWDITEGLDVLEVDPDDFEDMTANELHKAMHKSLGTFIDLMAAFVASTVMESLSEAVAEHLMESENKRDIRPFDDME